MAKPIVDQLRMDHLLDESSEDLKGSALKSVGVATAETSEPDKKDPRSEELYTFSFNYTDSRGKPWQGTFTNKILSISERQGVSVLKSRFFGGQPLESFDADTVALNGLLAHMMISLQSCPDWAKDLRQLKDVSLIFELGKEVVSHEGYYFRRDDGSQESGNRT